MPAKYIYLSLAVLLASQPFPLAANGVIQCWINDDGVRECGSVIPPKYVKREHEVLDTQGNLIREVGAEKSIEERRAIMEQQRREEEERIQREQQAKEDKALLDAYPSERDIIFARDSKKASVQAALEVAQNQVNFFKKTLEEAQHAHERTENPALLKHIENLKQQIAKFDNIILEKEQEKEDIHNQYQYYLERYRDIKTRMDTELEMRLRRVQQPTDEPIR
jgi:hypothetical protein